MNEIVAKPTLFDCVSYRRLRNYRPRERLLFEAEARLPDRPDLAARFLEVFLFLAGAFLLFFAELFRFAGVTLRTTALVVSPIDFCAAPALAARLPNVEPMLSAMLTSSPLPLSSALLPSVMSAPRLLGYRQKTQDIEQAHPHSIPVGAHCRYV